MTQAHDDPAQSGPGTSRPTGEGAVPGSPAPEHGGPQGEYPPTMPPVATVPGPSAVDRFFAFLRQLDVRRNTDDKWLAGVCSGIAQRLGVDPLVIRAALVVLILFGGIGLTIYFIAWAFIPTQRGEIVAERAIRHGDFWGIILLVIIALSLVGGPGVFNDGGVWWGLWVVVPIGVVTWVVMRNRGGTFPPAPGQPVQAWDDTPSAATTPWAQPTVPSGPSWAEQSGAPAAPVAQPVGGYPAGPPAPMAPSTYAAPPPRPPRRRSSGFLAAVVASGLAVTAYGLAEWSHREYDWAGHSGVVALAAALGVLGLSVLAFGLAGRRSGLTGVLAVLLLLATWTATVVPNVGIGGGLGERTWRPVAADTGREYRLGVGQSTLDLRDLPSTISAADFRVSQGVGEVRVVVPSDISVRVIGTLDIGEVSERGGDLVLDPTIGPSGDFTATSRDGRNLRLDRTYGSGTPDVTVRVALGVGQLTINQE